MYIFLSHASKEHTAAEELCKLLESKGHKCIFAPRDIRSGHEYAEEILDGIARADVMVLLLSEAANASPHVLREIERAVSKRLKIVVYQLEKVELSKSMEYFLMSHQWANREADVGYDSVLDCVEELAASEQVPMPQKKIKSEKIEVKKREAGKRPYLWIIGIILIVIFGALAVSLLGRDKQDPYENDAPGTNQQESKEPTAEPSAKLGDTISFGSYNGEPIEWRVIKLNEDGTAVVVSSNILTMKAFDAAESGKYNTNEGTSYWTEKVAELDADLQEKLRGSSQWSTSNIRTWLNSEKENVTYADQAPKATAMSELLNGYDAEPGFLSGFCQEELAAIVTTKVITGGITSEDKVFLLSKEELDWFEEADVNRMAIPTETALTQDKTGWYQMFSTEYGVEDYYWWLRDAAEMENGVSAYEVCVVTNSYTEGRIVPKSAGLEGFGVRPAMTIDLTALGVTE